MKKGPVFLENILALILAENTKTGESPGKPGFPRVYFSYV